MFFVLGIEWYVILWNNYFFIIVEIYLNVKFVVLFYDEINWILKVLL